MLLHQKKFPVQTLIFSIFYYSYYNDLIIITIFMSPFLQMQEEIVDETDEFVDVHKR